MGGGPSIMPRGDAGRASRGTLSDAPLAVKSAAPSAAQKEAGPPGQQGDADREQDGPHLESRSPGWNCTSVSGA